MPSSRSPANSISSSSSSASSSSASLSDCFDKLDIHDVESGADCACRRCQSHASSNCAYPSWPKGSSFDQSSSSNGAASQAGRSSSSGMGNSHISDEDLLDCPDDKDAGRNTRLDADADDCIAPGYHRVEGKAKPRAPAAVPVKSKNKTQVKMKDSGRRK